MNEQSFDVVIVGAGPTGCHCARMLAKSGLEVLLVEQHEDFYRNNFSSAGAPLETLERFDLPQGIIGSFWRKIEIVTTKVRHRWEATENLGVVFDFAKLRQFLANDSVANGGQVWLGCRYLGHANKNDETFVDLKKKTGETVTVKGRVLVDATGFKRGVIYPGRNEKPDFLKATGIEYQIEVPPDRYQEFAECLTFFLGHHWSPNGYSWIFPMDNNQLKVGSAWMNEPHKIVKNVKPLKQYLAQVISDYMQLPEYKIVDIHGSSLEYSSGLNDVYFRGNVIAIGDAVSTINFLGGEGIRHGMIGAEIAARHIQNYLKQDRKSFEEYKTEMREYFSRKWNLTEEIGYRVYNKYSDDRIDRGVDNLKHLDIYALVDILFHYRFKQSIKGVYRAIFRGVMQRIKSFVLRSPLLHHFRE